jgi:hypothetical protein
MPMMRQAYMQSPSDTMKAAKRRRAAVRASFIVLSRYQITNKNEKARRNSKRHEKPRLLAASRRAEWFRERAGRR